MIRRLLQLWSLWGRTAGDREVEPAARLVRIERYAFSFSQTVTLGTAGERLRLAGRRDWELAYFRPDRVVMNVPLPNFAVLDGMRIGNLSLLLGVKEDAYSYSPRETERVELRLPPLDADHAFHVRGQMTGFVPLEPFDGKVGQKWLFTVMLMGPAKTREAEPGEERRAA